MSRTYHIPNLKSGPVFGGQVNWHKQVEGGIWAYSPLYEELINIPLLIYVPGTAAGVYRQLTSAVDVMPTVLEILGCGLPDFVEGKSLLPKMQDSALSGREFTISSIPFANPGDPVRSVDNFLRMLKAPTVTTITNKKYSLLYSPDRGQSKLYDLSLDPGQQNDIISYSPDVGKELHQYLIKFMRDTKVAEYLLQPRLELCI